MKGALPLVLFAVLTAGVHPVPAQELHPRMRFTREEKRRWIEAYERASRVYLDPALRSINESKDLLKYLSYIPAERDQGSCGNCWQWAGTGCMEISHTLQSGIMDRFSIQYLNSCASSLIGKECCDGGTAENVAAFYNATRKAIPWSNANADWQDGDHSCDTACDTIADSPSRDIISIAAETIPTHLVGQEDAIENIKNVLDQNRPVFFAFFLADDADWNVFFNFWDSSEEWNLFNFDYSCNHPWDPAQGGGHAVLCVGYNDDDPDDRYWVMLNSWGAPPNRPNGLFRVDMDIDYDCADTTPDYNLYWQTLNVVYQTGPTPTPTPKPSTTGAVSVSSSPVQGAAIYLDYFSVGQLTNSILAAVHPGMHTVWVSHPAYPPQAPREGVDVVMGGVTTVSFELKDALQTGDILVESAPEKGAAVYLDYRNTGLVTDAALADIGPGTHHVTIRKDGTVPPGAQAAMVETGLTTPLLFELWTTTDACPISISSVPTGADIYLDYLPTGLVTDATIEEVGHGTHDVTVRKSGYLIPPPQTVELSAATCATSLLFDLMAVPTPTPTPPPTPTPFAQGLRVLLNNATLRPGDTFEVAVSFTDSIIDFDGYMVILRSDGRAWSILQGNRLVEGLWPIVADAMEIHYPWGPVTVFRMQIPYGVPGYYAVYGAILPAGTPPTLQNARGLYGQLDVEPARVLY